MRRFGASFCAILLLLQTALAVAALAPRPQVVSAVASPAAGGATLWLRPTPAATANPTLTPSPTPSPARIATAIPSATPALVRTATPTARATATRQPVRSRAIFVDQDAQVMHIYEDGVEIRTMPCSTGAPLPHQATPAWVGVVGVYVGTFFSFGTFADDAWYLFEAGGDILMHSAPYTWVDGVKVYQDLDALGRRPASHGCIRLRPADARWLSEWDPQGVPIAISPLTRGE